MFTSVVFALALGAVESPAIGAPAPAFSATDMAGKSVNLADYKGKYVVLEWTNNGCPFVKKHYGSGNMQATQKWAKDKGAVWLSVISSAPGMQGYVTADQAKGLYQGDYFKGSNVLLDPSGVLGHLYGAKTSPHIFIIDPDQKVQYMGAIDSKPSANPDDIEGATNYAKQALTELWAGKAVSVPRSKPYGCSVKYAD